MISVTVPLEYGVRAELTVGPCWGPDLIFYVGHTCWGFDQIDRKDNVQWRMGKMLRDAAEYGVVQACEYPPSGLPLPKEKEENIVENMRNPATKSEAIAFVSAVLNTPQALTSPDFNLAMTLSIRFDIGARDVLEYRRARTASSLRYAGCGPDIEKT